jgi:hypothetical protein
MKPVLVEAMDCINYQFIEYQSTILTSSCNEALRVAPIQVVLDMDLA